MRRMDRAFNYLMDILEEESDKDNAEVQRIVRRMFAMADDPNGKYPFEPGEKQKRIAA